jgi:hypothetical protein
VKLDQEAPMKAIPAEVIAVETQGDQYRVAVRIRGAKYRCSFNTLVFGRNKPFIGSCHDGRLDLVFHQNPDLKLGSPSGCGRFSDPPSSIVSGASRTAAISFDGKNDLRGFFGRPRKSSAGAGIGRPLELDIDLFSVIGSGNGIPLTLRGVGVVSWFWGILFVSLRPRSFRQS